ncbi:HEPN domain-containing protein [Candidatus Uhrbacteria bacterium]|nr:HEPN domain-containing protein [Candidatus Uhrbacteria bacterium]
MQYIQKHIAFWKESAERNLKTAKDLYKTRHFDACLFFCHLTLEKYLKARVIQRTSTAAPFTHDLVVLARVAHFTLTNEQETLLRTVNSFNISGRYDDYKLQFHKKATQAYTKKYLGNIDALYLWLRQH